MKVCFLVIGYAFQCSYYSTILDTLGCPSWNEIPNKFGDQFVCGVNYNGIGGDYEVNACNGNFKHSDILPLPHIL